MCGCTLAALGTSAPFTQVSAILQNSNDISARPSISYELIALELCGCTAHTRRCMETFSFTSRSRMPVSSVFIFPPRICQTSRMKVDWEFIGILIAFAALWWEVRKTRNSPSGMLHVDKLEHDGLFVVSLVWLGEGGAWDVVLEPRKNCTAIRMTAARILERGGTLTYVLRPLSDNPVVRVYHRPFGYHRRGYIVDLNLETGRVHPVRIRWATFRYWLSRLTGVSISTHRKE